MKSALLVLILLGVGNVAKSDELPILPVSIEVSKRVPVTLESVTQLRTYANDNGYYFSVNLKDGMRVLYSASYGMGGEAGQARGVIVERDGKFWFKQQKNTTMQLLLPPGLPINAGNDSLWDIGAYMDLINRVVFSEANQASKTANEIYGTGSRPEAFVVDFKGGTAGATMKYTDALELTYKRKVYDRSDSDFKVYYAKGVGPVAVEYKENKSPSGTFKIYVGE